MERLILIDGNAIVHRAYHALPPLTNRSGELLNAVYGFCTMLFKIITDLHPTYLVVAFDTPKPTFRHKEFIGYQAHRPIMDAELATQFAKVREVLDAISIPVFEKDGYEADDIIGTISKQAIEGEKGVDEVIIVTGDRDLFQLVESKIKVYMPIQGMSEAKLFDEKAVEEKMGVGPKQIVEYKGLVGDASDNYPGVPGIGPKTAASLLKHFETVENIYRNLEETRQMFGLNVVSKLEQGEESARLSKKLALILRDVSLNWNLEKCQFSFSEEDKAKIIAKLKELNFKSLVERLGGKKESEQEKKNKNKNKDQLGLLS